MATSSASPRGTTGPGTIRIPAPRRASDPPLAPEPPTRRRRSVVRRLAWVVAVLVLVVALAGILANAVVVGRLERIDGAFAGLTDRPPEAAGRTFLMVGTRPGAAGPDVPWLDGDQSVEAVMLVEVAADGLSARVDTLPASSGVRATAADERPSATVAAVEAWSGRRVDHLIAVDWDTFARLAATNGADPAYVYGSGPEVQHEYLQQAMEATLHQELRKRPLDLYRALSTTVDGTAVDDGWSVLEMDLLVLGLRNLRSLDITYAMAQPG
ncbi:hypothetical protein EUA93_11335 [Nocardioides oleivorans]|uniref:Cell envelope-related transcriptional attenuator domain-containing protein n=1 Tax=Nocardioides oleivorans TaxID=273676 RepID=A0A4Q2S3G4_9ACTN|nr:hypothetical protein [Nocardioides oleivorans]RYB94889.1 hypothetical protein EUA93_11335 [Nocardioides oleivorans]